MTPAQKIRLNSLIQQLVAAELRAARAGDIDVNLWEEERKVVERKRSRLHEYITLLVNK